MTDELIPAEGISRRDMLKRSAIVGGASAMVWAAPSLTTFAPRAFGDNGTPASDFSNFGAVIICDGKRYRIKLDLNEDGTSGTWSTPGTLGGCENAFGEEFFTDWCNSTPANGGTLGVTWDFDGSNIVLTAPTGCTFVEGAASALKQGQCCYQGSVGSNVETLTFSGPFANQDCAASGGVPPGSPRQCP
jgi:hypothetical protein